MKLYIRFVAVLCITLMLHLVCVESIVSQEDYTHWNLPDGVIARLGKGSIGSCERAIAFSPGGKFLAVATGIGIWLYDAHTLEEFALLTGHTAGVISISFSPDGEMLASGSRDETIKLWSVPDLREITTFEGHTATVYCVSFSPDGKMLASYDGDEVVKLWSVPKGEEIITLEHNGRLHSISFSPDGKTLAGAGDEYDIMPKPSERGIVKLWSVPDGREIAGFDHAECALSVSFSPDGEILASGGRDGTVKLWSVPRRQEIATVKGHNYQVRAVPISPDGKMLASGGDDGIVKLWSIPELKEVAALKGYNDIIISISFSPDGKVLASGSRDGALNIWDVATRKQISAIPGHMENIRSLSFSPDGSMIASGGWDRAVRLWSVHSWQEIQAFEHSGSISSVSFSSDGDILGASCQGGETSVKLWSVPERKEIATLSGHRDYIFSISFSPDGEMLASGSVDGVVKTWSLRTYQEVATLEHGKTVFSLSFSPNGEILATADAEVKLWSVPDWQEIATFDEGYSEAIECIAFSPDSTMLATGGGSWEDFVRLWSVPDGEEIVRLEGHTWIILSVAFSPDGRMLASASRDETIKLWSIPDGQEIGVLRGHKWRVNSVSFSPDGKTLASGSEDGTILLWDLQPYIDRLYNITAQKPEEAAVNPEDKAAILLGTIKDTCSAAVLPSHFALGQNYPNPSNPETWIPYQLAEDAHVFIRIYDLTGRCIRNLDLGHKSAGFYLDRGRAAHWDGKNDWGERVVSGIYLYQLEAGGFSAVGRLYTSK